MQLAPGLVIAGRFRLNRPLGQGSMGSVWHATHLGLDIPCAVKFMEAELSQTPELVARFESEAKSAAKLHSPNVVQILDHGVSDGVPYIAMELLDGEDLGKRLERLGRLAPIDCVRITRDVSRALGRAHAEGVVHRDLKPENVFLVKDMDRELAKVLDFGIAKVNAGQAGATTRAGQILGTPYYMSPEQARGEPVDARSDLWALGVIVFRCLTGKLPFDSDSLAQLLLQIVNGPIPVASEVSPDLPRRFDLWWARAAQRDPAKRFQTAKDMDVALALAFGFSPVAGKKTGGTLEMPMTDDESAMHLPARAPAPAPVATPATPPPSPFASPPRRASKPAPFALLAAGAAVVLVLFGLALTVAVVLVTKSPRAAHSAGVAVAAVPDGASLVLPAPPAPPPPPASSSPPEPSAPHAPGTAAPHAPARPPATRPAPPPATTSPLGF